LHGIFEYSVATTGEIELLPLSCIRLTTAVLLLSFCATYMAQESARGPSTSVALAAPAIPVGLADLDKDVDARVGALVSVFAKKGPFSGIVVVARDGKIIAARVAGAADLEHAAPMKLETPMRLASVTKPLTAAAVLLLRDRGLVELDAPIGRYLPEAPATWSKITVRQLLSHRSGLGEYAAGLEYEARRHRPATTAELWKMVVAVPVRAEPDYSNSNYVVLGALIERVTREPYNDAMRRLVFNPLDMPSTAVDSEEINLPGRAVGYRWNGHLEQAAAFDPTVVGASGSLRSTASDLVRFAHAISHPGFLSDDSRRQMFDAPPGGYGLGCFIGAIGTHRLVDHRGGFDGFSTYLGILTDINLCAIVLCNIEQTRTIEFGRVVLRTATGEAVRDFEVPEPVDYVAPPRTVTAEKLRCYAGEYQSELGVLKVAVDGDHLTLQVPREPRPEPLLPADQPGTFQIHCPAEVRLRFQDNDKQPSQTVELSVRGKVVVGTRVN
jgi:CubicO group peptidase (beta-lactamase class C family)